MCVSLTAAPQGRPLSAVGTTVAVEAPVRISLVAFAAPVAAKKPTLASSQRELTGLVIEKKITPMALTAVP